MDRENYKARYEELHEIFDQLLSAHQQVLIEIGELRTENGILKSILGKQGIEIPARYDDF
jgi:hypothetical protein